MRNVFFGLFLVLVLESALFAGWTWTEGGDGQRIVYPTSGWTWTEGRDGRRVVYPSSGWTWTEGRDGRRVIYPSSGWTWTEGGDGRRVVYPSSGWTWTEGPDGARIVYPSSGWTWTELANGHRVAYPTGDSPVYAPRDLLVESVREHVSAQNQPYLGLLLDQMQILYPGYHGDHGLMFRFESLHQNPASR